MSAPAQNPRPAPVSTMTRTDSAATAVAIAFLSLVPIAAVKALRDSGRLRRITATRSWTS